ncbi:MAG: hypothetical protein IJ306_10875 [Oscillospiraceae bacterium]|nr:hypothetical protein [Oscillospiraceae bacterium]
MSLLTRCYYTHASIGLEEDMNTFYSFVYKGFIVEKIDRYLKPGREPFPCQLYELEVSRKRYNLIKSFVGFFAENKSEMRYSPWGVFFSLLHIPYKKEGRYFCSQFVAEALKYTGTVKLKKGCRFFFPRDFKKIEGIRLRYHGSLLGMKNRYIAKA